MKICVVILNLFSYIPIILENVYLCTLSFRVSSQSFNVSNILQRIKTVNKMWCYKLLFFKLCFCAKMKILKIKIKIKITNKDVYCYYLAFPSILCVSFSSVFNAFFLSVFFFFPMFSVSSPLPTQENDDPKLLPL